MRRPRSERAERPLGLAATPKDSNDRGETTFVMRARTTTAGLLLGASLLGAYFALAQESPRPRPIVPPDVAGGGGDLPVIIEGTIERDPPRSARQKTPEPVLPPLSETSEPNVRAAQHIDAPPPMLPSLPPNLPPVIQAGGTPPPVELAPPPPPPPAEFPGSSSIPMPPPIAPPMAPDLTSPPPPNPVAPPSSISGPDLPALPTVTDPPPPAPKRDRAPVTPWSPKDKNEESTLRPGVPAVPVSRPVEPPTPPEPPSRFVVPRSGTKRPALEPTPVQTTTESPQPVQPESPAPPPAPAIPRFDQVKIFRTPNSQPVTGTPTGFERIPSPAPPPTPPPTPPPPPPPTPNSTGSFAPGNAAVGSTSMATPQLTIEKRGPFYQKAGSMLAYQIILRNIGSTTAVDIRVEDEIPGMSRRNIVPTPSYAQADRLAWVVPTLRPGEEKTFLLELLPNRAGDLVSTTSVVITQSTSFRTKQEDDGEGGRFKTPPPMPSKLDNFDLPLPVPGPHTGASVSPPDPTSLISPPPTPTPTPTPSPGPALISSPLAPFTVEVKPVAAAGVGQKVVFEVVVANKGTTPLSQLMLIGTLPAGLKHPAGDSIGADLPDLAAGETKTFPMKVTAAQVGNHTIEIRVKSKDNEVVVRPQVEVTAPVPGSTSNAAPPTAPPAMGNAIQQTAGMGLQLQIQGRETQVTIGRETIAVVNLANLGVVPASNVQLTLFLSDGLEATQNAQAPVPYRVNGKRIFFESVSGLAADRALNFHVGVRAVGVGPQNIRVQVTSDQERTPQAQDLRLTVVR
jgi:uncharacterized repeat protein (TIGR01451 family)